MNEIRSHYKIKKSSERNFGIVFTVLFLLISWRFHSSEKNISILLLLISIIFLLFSLLAPSVFKAPNALWFKFGLFLGKIVSPIVMGFIYVIGFLTIGFILKLIKKDLLIMKPDPTKYTYWIERKNEMQTMKNQF